MCLALPVRVVELLTAGHERTSSRRACPALPP
jgi:hydrogenase maturation factor